MCRVNRKRKDFFCSDIIYEKQLSSLIYTFFLRHHCFMFMGTFADRD